MRQRKKPSPATDAAGDAAYWERIKAAAIADLASEDQDYRRIEGLLKLRATADWSAFDAMVRGTAFTPEFVLRLVRAAEMGAISESQARRAAEKNEDIRRWVSAEWEKARGGISKAAFARAIVPRIRVRFPNAHAITPETIKTRWLPKASSGKP